MLERRLLAVRQEADGPPRQSGVDQPLLFQSAGHVPPGSAPLAVRGIGMQANAANHLEQLTRERLVGDRRKALEGELPERRRRVRAACDLRAADLASRRIQLAAKDDADEVAAVKLAQRDLVAEKAEALAELEAAPSRIAAREVQFVVHALAARGTSSDEINQYDERVEQIAVRTRRRLGGGAGRGHAGREQARPCPCSRPSRLARLRPPCRAAERRGPAYRSEGPPGSRWRARNRQRMDPGVPSGRQLLALCNLELRDARADHGPHPEPVRQAARQRARLDHLHDLPQVPKWTRRSQPERRDDRRMGTIHTWT